MKESRQFNKTPAMEGLKKSSEPMSFADYTSEERTRIKKSIQAKQGQNLSDEERKFLILQNEAILSEREDDQPRYGH